MKPKPILVTGLPRSGTTWTGKMLALSKQVIYVEEPFHPFIKANKDLWRSPLTHHFVYINDTNAAAYKSFTDRIVNLRFGLVRALLMSGSPKTALWYTKLWLKMQNSEDKGIVPLIKEPSAFFSASWLANTYDMNVVVVIRHPGAIAHSFKRLRWGSTFQEFLDQPLLMQEYLSEFESEMRGNTCHDSIDHAILLWKMFISTVIRYQNDHPEWIFIRHEDLSQNSDFAFKQLFERLNINYTAEVRSRILKHSDQTNPAEAPNGITHALARNSAATTQNWKNHLSREEIDRIRASIQHLADDFYALNEW